MAFGYKILGNKTGNNATQVAYTVPAGKSAIVSSLVLNSYEDNLSYQVWVVASGSSAVAQNQILGPAYINRGETHSHQFGITLAAGDSIHFYGTLGEGLLNFFVFGTEVDA